MPCVQKQWNLPLAENIALVSLLHWKRWDNEWLVFDSGSGQTHKLDAVAATLLLVCEEGSASFSSLVERVANQLVVPSDQSVSDILTRIVEQCESLGLLERVEG